MAPKSVAKKSEKKDKKCEECFERKPDVKLRVYEDVEISLCDDCFEQNQGMGQENHDT